MEDKSYCPPDPRAVPAAAQADGAAFRGYGTRILACNYTRRSQMRGAVLGMENDKGRGIGEPSERAGGSFPGMAYIHSCGCCVSGPASKPASPKAPTGRR